MASRIYRIQPGSQPPVQIVGVPLIEHRAPLLEDALWVPHSSFWPAMICITVTPESRTLGKVDILNAASKGDIVEVCLDHLIKEPDIKDLLSVTTKPVIVSCRRPQDGGKWDGTEDERLMLLRQAIVAGPAYVELDLDIAKKIPRFGKTQRVISFTRLDQPEHDLDAIIEEARAVQADVIKFTWPTPTIDDAWPLLKAASASTKGSVPIVGLGLGRGELTFLLLSEKYGAPWLYAALENGMEAYPGQATVFELEETYHLRDIDRSTAFIAVTGFGDSQPASCGPSTRRSNPRASTPGACRYFPETSGGSRKCWMRSRSGRSSLREAMRGIWPDWPNISIHGIATAARSTCSCTRAMAGMDPTPPGRRECRLWEMPSRTPVTAWDSGASWSSGMAEPPRRWRMG